MIKKIVKKMYWGYRDISAKYIGTKVYEKKWSKRGIEEVRNSFSNLNHPHRRWLVEQLDLLYPFSNVLEFGCGYGPNLQHIAEKYPIAILQGIDINPISVDEGNKSLKNLGLNNANICVGNSDTLRKFPDKSFDIVLTDAVLCQIGPDQIEKTLLEMYRISRKALLFLELHLSDSLRDHSGLGIHTPDGWIRDYQKMLSKTLKDVPVAVEKIPEEVWPGRVWPSFGYMITVIND